MSTETRGALIPDPDVSQTVPSAGPYVGLRPFNATEQHLFFGRGQDALFLCDKILAARLTVLYSQSGLGKSSLLRALVIPRLEAEGRVVSFHAWSHEVPLQSLKERLVEEASSLGVPSPDAGAPTLTELVQLIAAEDPRSITLILDQFEELFTGHAQHLVPMWTELAELIRTPRVDLQVVLSLREEFLAALEPFREQMLSLFESTYRLEPLDADSLRDAIRLPPERFDGSCEPELVERLIHDLRAASQEPGASAVELPLLQLVCSELWNEAQRAGQSTLTLALYEKTGGVRPILDRHVSTWMPRRWRDKVLAARLMRLLAPPSGVKVAYSAEDLAQNVGAATDRVESLVTRLSDARILQTRHSKRGRRYELQHDALIGVMRPWRDDVLVRHDRFRQTLVTLAVVVVVVVLAGVVSWWNQRYKRALERHSKLQDFVSHAENELESRPTFNLLLAATAYALTRSESLPLQAKAESALRLALARIGGRPFRTPNEAESKVALSADGSMLVITGDKGVLIWDVAAPDQRLIDQARDAQPRRVYEDRVRLCVVSPGGRWLAISDGLLTLRILDVNALDAPPRDLPNDRPISAMTFSADDRWFAAGGDRGDIDLWDLRALASGAKPVVLSQPVNVKSNKLHAIAFGRSDGLSLFGAYEGYINNRPHGVVSQWNLSDVERPEGKELWTEPVERGYAKMALSEGARWLAVLTLDDDARVARLAALRAEPNVTGARPDKRQPSQELESTSLAGARRSFAALAFGGPHARLAVTDRRGAIEVWNLEGRSRDRVLVGHDDQVSALSFSADGRRLASTSGNGTTRVWDLEMDGTHPFVFGGGSDSLRDLASSGSSPWLVIAGTGRGVRRIDMSGNGVPEELPVADHSTDYAVVSASEDGRWAAAGRIDGKIQLWLDPFRDRPAPATELTPFAESVRKIAFSRNSQWLAAGSDGNSVRIWLLRLDGTAQSRGDYRHSGDVTELAFSPDSRWLASASSDGEILIWRLAADGQQAEPTRLGERRGRVMSLVFDTSARLAVAIDDGQVRLWDVAGAKLSREPWNIQSLGGSAPSNLPRSGASRVNALAFTPDGRWLVAGTNDGRLLGIPIGRSDWWSGLLRRSTDGPQLLQKSVTAVMGLTFTRDGRIVVATSDGSVRIGRVDDPRDMVSLGGPTRTIWKLISSRHEGGNQLIGAISDDGRAWVWSVDSGPDRSGRSSLVPLACRTAGHVSERVCTDLQAAMAGLSDWNVCQVCKD